jgi:hypothetical protein
LRKQPESYSARRTTPPLGAHVMARRRRDPEHVSSALGRMAKWLELKLETIEEEARDLDRARSAGLAVSAVWQRRPAAVPLVTQSGTPGPSARTEAISPATGETVLATSVIRIHVDGPG